MCVCVDVHLFGVSRSRNRPTFRENAAASVCARSSSSVYLVRAGAAAAERVRLVCCSLICHPEFRKNKNQTE